jgi:hypothetical protein
MVRFFDDNPDYLLLIDACSEGKEISKSLPDGSVFSVRQVRKWK